MAIQIPGHGFSYSKLASRESWPRVGYVQSTTRQPSDVLYLTQLDIRGLEIGTSYSIYDATPTELTSGEFTTDPTTFSPVNAFSDSDPINVYAMYYGYKYKSTSFLLTRVSTLVYVALDANSNTTLSSAAASALTGIALDAGTKKITVSSTHSWSNVYDYVQYWQSLPANYATLKDGEILSTVLGNNYNLLSTWQLVLEAEVTGGVNFVGDVVINAVFDLTGFNVTGTVFFDVPGTYAWTNMVVDEVDTIAGETVVINPTNSTITLNSDPTNITINAPSVDLEVTSSESASDIKIFETGTQTIEASTTGTSVTTETVGTYDITVQKSGFLPQRQTGVVLSGTSVAVNITLIQDPVYNASHGLTFTTDYSYDANTRILTIVANQEGRDLYSALIDDFISETTLRNCPFPLVAVGPDRIDFKAVGYYNTATTVGATIDSGDVTFWKGAGMEWEHDTTGNPTKKFYSVKSANTLQTGSVVGYTQENAGTPSEATLVSDKVNQVIQYFEDTNGDGAADYEYTGHLLFKGFKTGYYQARWDVINDSGVTSLEPYEYTINLIQDAIAGATGDQAVTITTLTDHTGAPIDPASSGDFFDYELVDPGTTTAEDLLAQYNYDVFTAVDTLISGTIYTSYKAFDLPDLIVESGATYETEYGYFEGDGTVTDLSGVYVSRSGLDHPDFTRFQANDGTYYTAPVLAQVSAPNLTAGRVQLYNVTTATEIENTTITSGYSRSWTDGTDATSGDVLRLRWAAADKQEILATGVATSGGTTTFLDVPVDDDVYIDSGLTGSDYTTKFAADVSNTEIDIILGSDFQVIELYTWYKYLLTTASGIQTFFGGVTAVDDANFRINNTTVDVFFDNTTTANIKQTDNRRVYRIDEVYPVKDPTTGTTGTNGGGIDVVWRDKVFLKTTGGSALTVAENAKLMGLRDYNPESDNMEGSVSYQEGQRIMLAESAGKVSVSGTTVTFRDQADTKNRISATVDSNGQRTSVTVDGS